MSAATPLEEALAALEDRPTSLPPRARPGLSRPPDPPFDPRGLNTPEPADESGLRKLVEGLEDPWFSEPLVTVPPSIAPPPPPERAAPDDEDEDGPHRRDLSGGDPRGIDGRTDLRGINLAGADLRGRDFTGCDLSDADLSGADLTGARLVGARLTRAVLHSAVLHGAELARADLTGAILDHAVLSQAGFGDAVLADTSCFEADFSHASLVGATLAGADLRQCKAEGARLRRADLRGAELSGADLSHADLVETRVRGAIFRAVDFRRARLRHLEDFEQALFIEADIRDVDFSHAYLLRRFIMDQNYLAELRSRSRYHAILYWVWWATSDCGRSLARLGAWIAIVTIFFGAAYQQVDIDYGGAPTWLSPYYFSLVTLTTLGYGDVLPSSVPAQAMVMAEVVVGYMLLGGLISIFANKMARRAE